VHVNISATTDVQGRVTHLYGILMDITQRKSAQLFAQEQADEMAATLQELQQTQSQLIHSEKMSSLGQLVAGIAHEINNPINFISGNLTHARSYAHDLLTLIEEFEHYYPQPPEPLAEQIAALDLAFLKMDLPNLLESMNVGAQRIVEIVTSLRNFSRLDEAVPQVVALHEGIESTLMILRHRCKATGGRPDITIHRDYGQLPTVECYPGPLNQVFMDILAHALDAMAEHRAAETPHPGEIWLQTRFDPGRDQIIVQIRDNGPGIPEAVQANIFEPFFTTKALGKGTSMGLSMSYQIMTQRHHGQLHCITCAESGTVFTLILPRRQPVETDRPEQAQCLKPIATKVTPGAIAPS
jgi:signal transduction histidine kinase